MRKIILGSTIVIVAVVGTGLAYGPQKTAFVGRCLANGKPSVECACMFDARQDFLKRTDLPPIYGDLVRAWAHDHAKAYRDKLYTTVFWQSVRAVPVVREVLMEGGKSAEKPGGDMSGRVMKSISEQVLSAVSKRLGVAIVPWVHGAKTASEAAEPVWDFTKARALISKHCGGRMHQFVTPVETAHGQIKEQLTIYKITIADAVQSARKAVTVETIKGAMASAKATSLNWYERAKQRARIALGLPETEPGN